MRKSIATVAAAAGVLLAASPALADRPPTPAERAAIDKVLRAAGYVSWEEIELDDDGPRWEVDDARKRDRLRYDVRIDPRTMRITRAQRDD